MEKYDALKLGETALFSIVCSIKRNCKEITSHIWMN